MANFPFLRLQADLSNLIANTPPGERLPSEPVLAKQLGVSRATLRDAMRSFETQGLIRRRQGSGTYVVKVQALDSGLEVLESLETIAKRQGLSISVTNLSVDLCPADTAIAARLGISESSPLICVRRVICAEERPVAYLVDTLPEQVFHLENLPNDFHGSVLDLLLARGDALKTSRANISAIGATAEVAKALQIQRGDVLLHLESDLFDGSGCLVDYSLSYFIPGFFHLHVVRRVGV